MKRNVLSRTKHWRSKYKIDDVYSTFDADDLELLENKALAESFESLRQVTSDVKVGLNKTEAQLGDLKLKDKTESTRATFNDNAKETVEPEIQLANLAVKQEVTVRKTLSFNITENSENKTAIEQRCLANEPVIIEKPSRKFTICSTIPENAPSTPLKNTRLYIEQAPLKVDVSLVVNTDAITLIPVCDDVNIVADINSNDFEELYKQDFSTDDLLIDEHFDDETEDSFYADWEDDKNEGKSNEYDTCLDFLSDIDLEDIIDVTDSSFLGLLNENFDELVSFSQRARQAANDVTQEFDLSKESFELLCDIFLQNGWGPCRIAIIKQLNYGRSIKEIWNAHEIREIWRSMQDVWQLGKTVPAKFDQLRIKQKKRIEARKNLLAIEKLITVSDVNYIKVKSISTQAINAVKVSALVNDKKAIGNTMAWTLALRLVDFLDIQSVDSDFVSEFFCYLHQGWLDLIKGYRNPIRFEIYLHHQVKERPFSWRKPAPLPNEELWWNDTPSYSEDPYQLDCLMGRCYEENSNDYMDIKEQFNEL